MKVPSRSVIIRLSGGYVPLAKMFGYATDLRSLTQGRGNYVMQYDHYEKAPPDVLEQLFKSRGYGYVI
ncbi:MAG: hypothetical protein RJR35_00160 [Thermoanaerobacterales bacterium]|nr:hypothetical protein [Thermoanaerobacterales bacterium]